jgi:hypothetical protein
MRLGNAPVTMKLPKIRKLPTCPQSVGHDCQATAAVFVAYLCAPSSHSISVQNPVMFRTTFLLALLALIFFAVFSAGYIFLQHLQGAAAQRPAKNAPHVANVARHNIEVISNPHAGAKPNPPRAEHPKPQAQRAGKK